MTVTGPAGTAEEELLLRVLSTLLREDVLGLRTRTTVQDRADGRWLRLPCPDGRALALPVVADGFQCEYAARLPMLQEEPGGRRLTSGAQVLAALAALAPLEDRTGFGAFAAEYEDALAALRLQAATHDAVMARLGARHGADPVRWRGLASSLAFDTLAARAGHPLYPTAAARPGLGDRDLTSCAPEFAPRFDLRWAVLPEDAVTAPGPHGTAGLGAFWPRPSALGLPGLDESHLALPVHPLTAAGPLRDALREAGLAERAFLADRPHLAVAPTLSMRTVALAEAPGVHLKLPLATSTLGLLNRRTIKPGSLTDGAAGQRLLETVAAREPRFAGRVLHADETRYVHAGHELLAALVRRHPGRLDGTVVLPLAALTAPAPDGRPVIEHLAAHWFGGEVLALLDAVLTLLLDWQTTLFGYGIALESHQQNISLLLDGPAGRPRLRLLFKDDDGPRINRFRLRDALGSDAPGPAEFADPRIFADDDGPVLDLFTTITVHLCAGAFAFTLARYGHAP